MSCKMSRNEAKWFWLTAIQYAGAAALVAISFFNRNQDSSLSGIWALVFLIGCGLMISGFISEFVMRYFNEKEGDRIYSEFGI